MRNIDRLLKRRLSSMTPNRIGSLMSSRANSDLIKNFYQQRMSTNTPLSIKSKKI